MCRVVKSIKAAKTLAMIDLIQTCIFYKELNCILLHINVSDLFVICKKAILSYMTQNTQIIDKRLRIEMAIFQEMLTRDEMQDIQWIFKYPISDRLTKRGVLSFKIFRHKADSKLPLSLFETKNITNIMQISDVVLWIS